MSDYIAPDSYKKGFVSCPSCREDTIKWYTAEITIDMEYDEYECYNCGLHFRVWRRY